MNDLVNRLDEIEVGLQTLLEAVNQREPIGELRVRIGDLVGECRDSKAAALSAGEQMVVVPREPTEEMMDAGWQGVTVGLTNGKDEHLRNLYRAMIAAAPSASSTETEERS